MKTKREIEAKRFL